MDPSPRKALYIGKIGCLKYLLFDHVPWKVLTAGRIKRGTSIATSNLTIHHSNTMQIPQVQLHEDVTFRKYIYKTCNDEVLRHLRHPAMPVEAATLLQLTLLRTIILCHSSHSFCLRAGLLLFAVSFICCWRSFSQTMELSILPH